jgi:hypothetical protein
MDLAYLTYVAIAGAVITVAAIYCIWARKSDPKSVQAAQSHDGRP